MLAGGDHPDSGYRARRDGAFVVAVSCTEPGGLCFCSSMGTGPACAPGYDLVLTERVEGETVSYLVESGSPAGAEVLAEVPAGLRPPGSAPRQQSGRRRCRADGTADA